MSMNNMTIIRKATGKVIDRNVSEDMLELVLSCQPFGVYDVEDSHGRPLKMVTVKRTKILFNNPVE